MTSPVSASTLTVCVVLVLSAPGWLRAQSPALSMAPMGSPDARVRALDRAARRILERAVAASPTVVRMVNELETTDLIVIIQTYPLPKFLRGDARVVATTPGGRYLRIRLNVPNDVTDLIVVLGHELRHALEIAAMPEVRDSATLREAYRRIGHPGGGDGYYETEAALEAGRTVARELAAHTR